MAQWFQLAQFCFKFNFLVSYHTNVEHLNSVNWYISNKNISLIVILKLFTTAYFGCCLKTSVPCRISAVTQKYVLQKARLQIKFASECKLYVFTTCAHYFCFIFSFSMFHQMFCFCSPRVQVSMFCVSFPGN